MKHTISVLVDNQPGVLSKVSGLFSRRGFNIESLSVGETEDKCVSRMTIVVDGDDYLVEQIEKQLNKLIPVIKVKTLNEGNFASRVLMFFKVATGVSNRLEIMKIAEMMGAKIVDAAKETIIIEITDTFERCEALENLLRPFGIREIVRTGSVAIETSDTITNTPINK